MPKKTTLPARPQPGQTEVHMGRAGIAAIITRIVGVYAFIHALDYIQIVSWTITQVRDTGLAGMIPLLMSMLVFLALLGLGVYLFFRPHRFAAYLVRESDQGEHAFRADVHDLQIAAFSVVGLLVVIHGLTLSARILAFILNRPEPLARLSLAVTGDVVSAIVQLVIGLYLLIDSRGVVNLVRRIRGE